jgi:hypothetical protein
LVFKYCYEKKIPASIVGPIGMGAALVNIIPGKMSFHDYFQWNDNDTDFDLGLKFLLGLTPSAMHRSYLVDPSRINLKEHKGPSTPMGIHLCTGVLGSEVLKILLNRGRVLPAPWSIVFDAYHNRLRRHYLPFGNRNPLQRLKMFFAKRTLKNQEYSANA